MAESMPKTVVIAATRDNTLDGGDGDQNHNWGGSGSMWVGFENGLGPNRAILFFPLNGVANNNNEEPLTEAKLQLSIGFTHPDHALCRSTVVPTVGCATVHVVTTDWGEGSQSCFCDANLTESSWISSSVPMEWNTPGGDFEPNPIGQRTIESEVEIGQNGNGMTAEFTLNVTRVAEIINNPEEYFGLLVMDDDDPGWIRFGSRGSTETAAPRLVLQFGTEPSPAPIVGPVTTTLAPSLQPTVSPVESAPPVSEFSVCSDFEQSLVLASSLSLRDIDELDIIMGQELENLTPRYAGNLNGVATTAAMSRTAQIEIPRQTEVEVQMAYELCYQAPTMTMDRLPSLPSDFVDYMNIRSNRLDFESRLEMNGIQVIPRSLSAAMLVDNGNRDNSSSNDNTATIAGGVVGTLLLVLLVVGLFIFRRRSVATSNNGITSDHQSHDELSLAQQERKDEDVPIEDPTAVPFAAALVNHANPHYGKDGVTQRQSLEST